MLRPLPLKFGLLSVALLGSVFGALLLAGRPTSQLRVIFPALPGDAALILTPDGRSILIDGGADGAALATWLGQTLPFGQRQIDALLLTRTDSTTLAGQITAIKRYSVGTALFAATDRRTSSLDAWWQLLEAQRIVPQAVSVGDQLVIGQCTLQILSEHEGRLTVGLRCGSITAYFLQSVDDTTEAALELESLSPATLVMYPWDRTSVTPLLTMLQPTAIVFSEGGADNVRQTWAARQVGTARLYHEALNGQIELRVEQDRTIIDAESEE